MSRAPRNSSVKYGYAFHGNNNYDNWSTMNFIADQASYVSDPNHAVKESLKQDSSHSYSRVVYSKLRMGSLSASDWILVNTVPPKEYRTWGIGQVFPADFGSCVLASRPDIDQIALDRVKRRLRNTQNDFNSLVPLAEIKEMRGLIHSVSNSAFTLVGGLLELKKGRIREAARKASDLWLTWSFGVSPTISDIADLSGSIQTYLSESGGKNVHVASSKEDTWRSSGGVINANVSQYVAGRGGTRFEHHYKCSYTGAFLMPVHGGNDYGLAKHLGFDFGQIIPTFWELVPYSWIVDYFTNAGTYLEDYFHSPNARMIYLNKSVKYTKKAYIDSWQPVNQAPSLAKVITFAGSPSSYEYTNFLRTPLSVLPVTPLRFKSADEIARNSVNRLLNLTSLLMK